VALAAIDYAWTVLDLSELVSFAMLDNVASRGVMEKTGFAYEREILHERVPDALYRRARC
jgi:RimJ/RimL family protein N-acetyltransferase